ncbi:DedA family protein [Neisseria leonii]|uniref:DedA family protein n=1 Tax=Neisseria leonii TaxID=2995413 RepID=A0A9X4E178_9NEIS|nr:DedA family protein [Neisseria sp. 51.81]MDD9327622.1 DedA family protein [Neisseria sp. 51.81]
METLVLAAGLFVSALTSATILPGTSEAALAAWVYRRDDWALAYAVVLAGNVGGSLLMYAVGRKLPQKRPLPVRATAFLHRWGAWALLLAWVPVIGDALPVAAGWLHLRFWPCFWALLFGKALRYIFLVAVLLQIL